jgi:bifunctional DNA-binding transcriptional regulator/antitoxin component of YhaV-PrlF toxin-antitoxin module
MSDLRPRVKLDARGRITLPEHMRTKYGLKHLSLVEVQDLGPGKDEKPKLLLTVLVI